MSRRVPIVATMIVVAAVLTMIGLGVWQLQRAQWKESLIARYQATQNQPPIIFPTVPIKEAELPLFRHATAVCLQPVGRRVTAGRNAKGETGYAVIVECRTGAEGPGLSVEVGWSRNPNAQFDWPGGPVSGVIAPDRRTGMRLVAASAPAGLEIAAPPSLDQIPNNHRSYAVQWFAFAAIASLIYGLALRQRGRRPAA
ncbi:MAG TPA: SURF1 family protein [Sphingomicrobium sp.]|nr:SURF1 family protein [Sphingomicrobium sp.]